eukprot:bmy_06795T0
MSVRPDAPREEGDAGDRGQEAEPRGRASSRQRQRRQATRFLHKDSADLLPLDGLKRLGTSKDWLKVHPPGARPSSPAKGKGDQTEISIQRTSLQTASTAERQMEQGSRLGKRVLKAPAGDLAPGPPAQVEPLELQLGQATVVCSARVVDALIIPKVLWPGVVGGAEKGQVLTGGQQHSQMVPADVDSPELCLGLQTLLSLKCCIDLEHHVLRLKAPFPELPFLPLHQEPGQ